MASRKGKMTNEVSFLADDELDDHIHEMVDAYEGKKSALLRLCAQAAYTMRVGGRPTCANGEACRAPQLFMNFGIPPAATAVDRPDPDTNRQLAGRDDS